MLYFVIFSDRNYRVFRNVRDNDKKSNWLTKNPFQICANFYNFVTNSLLTSIDD